jgi:cytochrome c oxidase subunit 4
VKHPTAKIFLFNYAALMVLLGLTAVTGRASLGAWNTPLSLAIATAKMLLVLLFFMQLWWQRGLVRVFAAAGFFWLAIAGVLTFADYLTRGWLG